MSTYQGYKRRERVRQRLIRYAGDPSQIRAAAQNVRSSGALTPNPGGMGTPNPANVSTGLSTGAAHSSMPLSSRPYNSLADADRASSGGGSAVGSGSAVGRAGASQAQSGAAGRGPRSAIASAGGGEHAGMEAANRAINWRNRQDHDAWEKRTIFANQARPGGQREQAAQAKGVVEPPRAQAVGNKDEVAPPAAQPPEQKDWLERATAGQFKLNNRPINDRPGAGAGEKFMNRAVRGLGMDDPKKAEATPAANASPRGGRRVVGKREIQGPRLPNPAFADALTGIRESREAQDRAAHQRLAGPEPQPQGQRSRAGRIGALRRQAAAPITEDEVMDARGVPKSVRLKTQLEEERGEGPQASNAFRREMTRRRLARAGV